MAWQNNKKIRGLYAYGSLNRNAWVYISGMGWRRLWHDHDSQIVAMMAMSTQAKAKSRPVNFYEQNNKIREMYVL